MNIFIKYSLIGVLNTIIHWFIFSAFIYSGFSQAKSNFIAFFVAVSFSFFANSKATFKKKFSCKRYFLYTVFMAVLAFLTGYTGDCFNMVPITTLFVFSGISLVVGFFYSKLFVFGEKK